MPEPNFSQKPSQEIKRYLLAHRNDGDTLKLYCKAALNCCFVECAIALTKTHTLPLRYEIRKSLLVTIYLQKHFVCEILRNWVKSHFDKITLWRYAAVFCFAGARSLQKT